MSNSLIQSARTLAKLKAATDGIEPEMAALVDAETQARLKAMETDHENFAAMLANDFTAAVDATEDRVQQARLAVSKLEPLVAQLKQDRAWIAYGQRTRLRDPRTTQA